MADVWLDVIQEALNETIESSGSAVAGAKLRNEVARIAKGRGLEFPPPGMGRFSSLIEQYPDDFIVHRLPGQDLLVAPKSRADLLLLSSSRRTGNLADIREDLFAALTLIDSSRAPYFLPNTDSVIWVPRNSPSPEGAFALPATTLDQELALRQMYADTVDDPNVKDSLTKALKGESPLHHFGATIKYARLSKKWHIFRLQQIAERLRLWAEQVGVHWNPNWVGNVTPHIVPLTVSTAPSTAEDKRQFFDLMNLLTEEDISRISVPLDIVLRLVVRR